MKRNHHAFVTSNSTMSFNRYGSSFDPLPWTDERAGRASGLAEILDIAEDMLECDPRPLDPTPIHQQKVQVVSEIKLGSSWTPDEGTADFLKLFLSKTSTERSRNIEALMNHNLHEQFPPVTKSIDDMMANCPLQIESSTSHLDDDDVSISSIKSDALFGDESITAAAAAAAVAAEFTPEDEQDPCSNSKSAGASRRATYKPEQWQERFEELVEFRKERGNCLVPHNWSGNRSLAQWVKRQRYQYKLKKEGRHSTLTDERLRVLEEMGFVWSSHRASWEERFNDLAEFSEVNGHCNVPSTYPENHQLSVWVKCQRRQYKLLRQGNRASTMTKERIVRLTSLGFCFNPRKLKI